LSVDLNSFLSSFQPISLEEMDSVKLMNRTDTKYIFNKSKLPSILESLKNDYRCFFINGTRLSTYKTLYFDTEDFLLYRHHHNGILNRYKLRHRSYVESNLNFLEIKFKTNKDRTIKTRIKNKLEGNFDAQASQFIEKIMPYKALNLKPNVWINYQRITLVNIVNGERLTIDTGLEIINNDKVLQLDKLVIAELKRGSKQFSPFIKLMRDLHIQPGGISKYCMALALTQSNLKTNNFKEKLLKLRKV
jgi:hypothetical protein